MKFHKLTVLSVAATVASVSFITSVHAEDGLRALPDPDPRRTKPVQKIATEGGSLIGRDPAELKLKEKFATTPGELLNKRFQRLPIPSSTSKERFATRSAQPRPERIAKLSETMIQRFNRVTQRQENILTRANARIASLSAEGKDVTTLNAKSASVSAMIAKQKTSIEALKTTLAAISATNGTNKQTIGKAISDVVKQVNATQAALKDLVRAIAKLAPPKAQ